MNTRSKRLDFLVGLVVACAGAAGLGLFFVASGGPGYLTTSRTSVDVLFRDAQGLRVGQAVRVAGLEAGRVAAVSLHHAEGQVRARVRISVPSDLAGRLKQDAVISIQPSLTGQCSVNIASLGERGVAWVPGQPITGVESSLFDPILEQVGLGPIERGHLSHTIAEVRASVDDTVPRVRKLVASLQQAAATAQSATDAALPGILAAAKELEEAAPRVRATLARLESVAGQADELIKTNRPAVDQTLANVRDLTSQAKTVLAENGPKVGPMMDGLELTRKRADRLLYNADTVATNATSLLIQNRPELDRTVANVRDATDYARMLTQKIYANPFLISPLYKPTRDDYVTQTNFDTAQLFLEAAREFTDAMKRLETLRGDPAMAQHRPTLDAMVQQAAEVNAKLNPIASRLADGVQSEPARGGPLRNLKPGN
jgi:phospholipid/cholesterol/gamma-HCH transport system substrate-binding protein